MDKRAPCTYFAYRTPYGNVFISSDDHGIVDVVFGSRPPEVFSVYQYRPSALTNQASNELLMYFADKRRYFDVPLSFNGTDFQCSVWKAACSIPFGFTATCSAIACRLNSPSSHRSVGVALRRSTLSVFVPVHRIVRSNGQPIGDALTAKFASDLLAFESSCLG